MGHVARMGDVRNAGRILVGRYLFLSLCNYPFLSNDRMNSELKIMWKEAVVTRAFAWRD
jgi:hypothetical protein